MTQAQKLYSSEKKTAQLAFKENFFIMICLCSRYTLSGKFISYCHSILKLYFNTQFFNGNDNIIINNKNKNTKNKKY